MRARDEGEKLAGNSLSAGDVASNSLYYLTYTSAARLVASSHIDGAGPATAFDNILRGDDCTAGMFDEFVGYHCMSGASLAGGGAAASRAFEGETANDFAAGYVVERPDSR
jgi:hypothetical protein